MGTARHEAARAAQRQIEEWKRQYEDAQENAVHLQPGMTPDELVALARDEARMAELTVEDLDALNDQWQRAFGKPLFPDFDNLLAAWSGAGPEQSGSEEGYREQAADADPLPDDDTMLDAKEVCRLIGVHKATLRRLVDRGDFPAPHRPTERGRVWPARQVKEWRDAHGPRSVPPRIKG